MATHRLQHTEDRFTLVTAAHRFILSVVPFREPESYDALAAFTATAASCPPSIALDAILLRCLAVLDTEDGQRIPSLVDFYLANRSTPDGSLTRFTECVAEFLRHRCIKDASVQQAIAIIDARYAEPSLDSSTVAKACGVRRSALEFAFKHQMSCTVSEHIRKTRLKRAAILLVTTNRTMKEIWAEIGYNHPSSFDHDFKWRFGKSPRDFRSGSIRPVAQAHYHPPGHLAAGADKTPQSSTSVLIVDDDETIGWTLATYLTRKGFQASTVATGKEGLRRAAANPPDVILLDYRLDDMDGIEFLRQLHLQTVGRVPAVAVFTADWNLFDRLEEVDAFGATVVSKLCDLGQLERAIVTHSQRRATVAHSAVAKDAERWRGKAI